MTAQHPSIARVSGAPGDKLRVAVTGSSGLIGQALVAALATAGHEVRRVVRREVSLPSEIAWDPASGRMDAAALENTAAVVHLAGRSIAGGRWTAATKRDILDSRVRGTELLARTLASLRQPPRVLVSASAIGYYGDRGDAWVDESSAPGRGFLAEVCQAWEAATAAAQQAGIRVVLLRIGVVLSPHGGALAKMLTPFKLGAGGVIGSGAQYMSWIALRDLVGAIEHCLRDERLRGPVNAVAPEPVTNRQFTRTLGKVLHRPTVLPLPAFAVRAIFGEMGQELLLEGARVRPAALEAARMQWRHPALEDALRAELERA